MLFYRVLCCCVLFTWTLAANAEKHILMGMGISIPPYVIADADRGIAVDVFRVVMAEEGFEVDIDYADNVALVEAFNEKTLDVIFLANRETAPEAYFSEYPLVVFHNYAVALTDVNTSIKPESIRDLADYRLGAFRLAHQFLPAPFAAVVDQAADYREYSHQIEQVKALFNKDREVLVIDQTIFRYYLSQLRRQAPESLTYRQSYRYYNLFPKTEYFAVFHNQEYRDAFNRGMTKIRASGRYERILRAYQALLSDYLFSS